MELLELNFNFLSAPVKGCARIDGTDFFFTFLPAPFKDCGRTSPALPHVAGVYGGITSSELIIPSCLGFKF